ncbi:hypothetical protein [Bradyrhizobium sp. Leo170]|uniref:hypothetical protein n=1 Tax=Bradyrhizobium sp. Leo170 TaxID=1571199 RepID=UPI00102EC53D|nr:hypothetical protein [Bradyrhizobium sp. Leo170]TAI67661.1 hypothetical protein CWO89_01280 [Bradyrhizobium sp. Leo170]
MSRPDNKNRGAVWKNDEKQSDRHPDFRGSLDIEGMQYWIDAWKRKPGANPKAPALSFSIKRKEPRQPGRAGSYRRDMDDDIPFAPELR